MDLQRAYDELLQRVALLEKRVRQLESDAGKGLGTSTPAPSQPSAQAGHTAHAQPDAPTLSIPSASFPVKRLSAEQRIDLFMELFAHRQDMFALRYETKAGKKGYGAVCSNKWKDGLCDIKRTHCGKCENRALAPLTSFAIRKHLEGTDPLCRDVVGVYPIASDNTTRFLAIDIDSGSWREAARGMLGACKALGVPAFCERSRSGQGAHVWLFFSGPVSCKAARKLGCAIVTQAMDIEPDVDFSCYDRMFPNQDILPKGGFGNLIALPLQGRARRNENSVFVNEDFAMYADQWAVLQQARATRISPKTVQDILNTQVKNEPLGALATSSHENGGTAEKLWDSPAGSQIQREDFPGTLEVARSDKLYIKRKGISEQALASIRRLASFENPDYHRKVALRMSTHGTPRVITCSALTPECVIVARGCEDALVQLLQAAGARYEIADETNHGKDVRMTFAGELRPEQKPAAQALLDNDMGILWAATAFGKTVIGAYTIARLRKSALVLVHSNALLQQWKERLEDFLVIDEPPRVPENTRGRKKAYSPVGILGGGKDTLTGNVDVATYQSLVKREDRRALLDGYGVLIVDECHHSSAVTYEKVIAASRAARIYGVSATPVRADGHHPISFMLCGPVRYKRTAKEQAKEHEFCHVVIPRFTGFARPVTVEPSEWGVVKAQQCLSEDERRNALIVHDALEAWGNGRSPIVLTERVKHAERLCGLLEESCPNVYHLAGTGTAKSKRDGLAVVRQAAENGPVIVVATGRYAGEGFDLPRLDTLCLAAPVSGSTPLSQYTGRLHRSFNGKTEVRVYDYVDFQDLLLEKMYHRRLKHYASLGYSIRSSTEPNAGDEGAASGAIFIGPALKNRIADDMSLARREIVICSPLLHKSRFHWMLRNCLAAQRRGTRVLIITQPLGAYAERKRGAVSALHDALDASGVKWRRQDQPLHRFACIDGHSVWYGSVDLLGYWADTGSMACLENAELASELLESVRLQLPHEGESA